MRKLFPLAALGLALAVAAPALADDVRVGVSNNGVRIEYRDHDRGDYRHRGDYRRGHRWMDRRDVERHLYRHGYVRVYDMDRYGDSYYRARCVDRRGSLFLVTIDAYNGRIIRVQFIGRERYRRW